MDDKTLVQHRFRWLKAMQPGLDGNSAFVQAVHWLQALKAQNALEGARRAWDEAPLKRGEVEALIQRCASSSSFTEAVRLVGSVFSDPSRLGKCFPLPSSEVFKLDSSVADDLDGFDFEESDRVVKQLFASSPAVANSMSYAIRTLRTEITATAPSMTRSSGKLRAIRIAMVLEGVQSVSRAQLLRSLANAPRSIVTDLAIHLIKTWGPLATLEYLQSVVAESSKAEGAAFAYEYVEVLMVMMQHLWHWNRTQPAAVQIPAAAFVNTAIAEHAASDESFLEREIVVWFLAEDRSRSSSLIKHTYILDTASRAHVLQVAAELEHRKQFHQAAGGGELPFLVLRVRRDQLVSDTMEEIVKYRKEELRKPLKVQFMGEEGVDAGGVRKEYFLLMLRQLLDPSFGMFRESEAQTKLLWFSPDSLEAQLQFELVGVLIGLAISNRVIVDVPFPRVLYKLLLQRSTAADDAAVLTLEDLAELDPPLTQGLKGLLEFTGDVESVYCRTFEVSRESWGVMKSVELVPGGSRMPVTNANREQYVALYVQFVLVESVRSQLEAFRRGFLSVMDDALLAELHFTADELELLVVGTRSLDFAALEASARYDDGFDEDSKTVKTFWRVVHALSDEEKRTLLRFITGSDRVPIRGLGDVRIVISRAGSDSDLLPSSHTCFDHLLLPDYGDNEEKLRSKLMLALEHAQGFFTR